MTRSILNLRRLFKASLGIGAGWCAGAGMRKHVSAETNIPIKFNSEGIDKVIKNNLSAPPDTEGEAITGTDLCNICRIGGDEASTIVIQRTDLDVNARHVLGWSPLMVAAHQGNTELIKILIDKGANVNARDEWIPEEATRANAATRRKQFQNISEKSETTGFTPLHYAILSGHVPAVEMLIWHGASLETIASAPHITPKSLVKFLSEREAAAMEKCFEPAVRHREALEKDARKKHPIEERLKENIVGQLAPIHSVSSAIRRKENSWHDPNKPLVFLFLGSSGIGKTELAKQVAKYLHNDTSGFIRIDMSEYQHAHEVAKFIGSPPGYVGHEQGGQLTTKLSEKNNAVVLLDEVEKAHPDVLTVMLQVFDEGRITDGKGNTTECKDAIFIMTSNLGQRRIADEAIRLRHEAIHNDKQTHRTDIGRKFRETIVQPILKKAFKRDEFLGRINETLFFLPFTDAELELLIEKELNTWKDIASSRHNMSLSWSTELVKFLKSGYNVRYGARSIKHEIERSCVGLIASSHEANEIHKGSKIHLDFVARQPASSTQGSREEDDMEECEGVLYKVPEGEVVLTCSEPETPGGFLSSILGKKE